jgi:type II secretory pathway component GspD/PulD (secretin)
LLNLENPVRLPLILSLLTLTAPLISAGLPDGTKGTLNLSVAVQDELGIDTVSEMVELKHVKASELEGFIRTRLSRWGTVQTDDALNMVIITDKKEKLRDLSALLHKLDSNQLKDFLRLESVSIPLNYTDPNTIQSTVKSQMSPEGILVIDSAHNALLITDLKSKIESVKALVAKLDTFVPQAVLELAVVESNDDLLRNAGLDWGVLNQIGVSGGIGSDKQQVLHREDDSSFPFSPYNYKRYDSNDRQSWNISGNFNVGSFLNIITNKNKGKVMLQTRLSSANGSRATFNSGNQSFGGGGFQAAPETGRGDGMYFSVLPRIGEGEMATLDIQAAMNNFLGWDSSNRPLFDGRSVNTSALMKDGETLVLGGLKKIQMVDDDKGIPVLRSILPFLFSRRTKSRIESDLTLLVTLHIKRAFASAPDETATKALEGAREPLK